MSNELTLTTTARSTGAALLADAADTRADMTRGVYLAGRKPSTRGRCAGR